MINIIFTLASIVLLMKYFSPNFLDSTYRPRPETFWGDIIEQADQSVERKFSEDSKDCYSLNLKSDVKNSEKAKLEENIGDF